MDWSLVIQAGVALAMALAVYVGIRIDLAAMHEKIKAADARITVVAAEATKAHDRIDGWYRTEHRP